MNAENYPNVATFANLPGASVETELGTIECPAVVPIAENEEHESTALSVDELSKMLSHVWSYMSPHEILILIALSNIESAPASPRKCTDSPEPSLLTYKKNIDVDKDLD